VNSYVASDMRMVMNYALRSKWPHIILRYCSSIYLERLKETLGQCRSVNMFSGTKIKPITSKILSGFTK